MIAKFMIMMTLYDHSFNKKCVRYNLVLRVTSKSENVNWHTKLALFLDSPGVEVSREVLKIRIRALI